MAGINMSGRHCRDVSDHILRKRRCGFNGAIHHKQKTLKKINRPRNTVTRPAKNYGKYKTSPLIFVHVHDVSFSLRETKPTFESANFSAINKTV